MTEAAEALDPAVGTRERLRQVIDELSLLKDRDFKLASGAESAFYFDMKRTMLDPEGADLVADAILAYLLKAGVRYLGGMAVGAVPLVSQVVVKSHGNGNISGFYVRSEKKDHGTEEQIFGILPDPAGSAPVVLCEDVTTTGGSVMTAIDALRAKGHKIHSVVTVVDRLAGAAENLAKEDITLASLYTKDDFAT